ncbi:MAG: DUF5752 family protein [Acidobacteriia bacterium]|nr:DUF5752 family protein [Terriglobia bacterium]
MRVAEQPFQFVTASYLTRIGNQKTHNLTDLGRGLEESSEASIFYHTFQSLGRHHFLTEGFSNDFAQWVLAACNRPGLAEQLASLDIRDYIAVGDLRRDLQNIVAAYCDAHPEEARQAAFEDFFFCEAIEVSVPLGIEAWTLEEFRRGLEMLSHASFHFHFISSRLRLQLHTNDFSLWLAGNLGLESLAKRLDRIDIYTNTIEGAQAKMLALVDKELAS